MVSFRFEAWFSGWTYRKLEKDISCWDISDEGSSQGCLSRNVSYTDSRKSQFDDYFPNTALQTGPAILLLPGQSLLGCRISPGRWVIYPERWIYIVWNLDDDRHTSSLPRSILPLAYTYFSVSRKPLNAHSKKLRLSSTRGMSLLPGKSRGMWERRQWRS